MGLLGVVSLFSAIQNKTKPFLGEIDGSEVLSIFFFGAPCILDNVNKGYEMVIHFKAI